MNYEDILCGVVSVSGKQGPAGPVGPQGEPGYGSAYLGPTQPDNPNITIWYDTSGEEVIIKIKQNGEWVVAVDWTDYATQTWVENQGYLTEHQSLAGLATESYVNSQIANIDTLRKEIVSELPTENIDDSTIYLVQRAAAVAGNIYDEYMYINGAWEFLGTTDTDLADYAKKDWVEQKGYQTAADVSTTFDNKITAIFSFNAETGRLDITV